MAALSQKEVDYQLAIGAMTRSDAFIEHIKRTVKPVPWPPAEDLHKVYPNLKHWTMCVDKALGEVTKQFNIFFTEEEIDDDDNDIYINFGVNEFNEDYSVIMIGNGNDICDEIFEHLQIISPLLVTCCGSIVTPNIKTTAV